MLALWHNFGIMRTRTYLILWSALLVVVLVVVLAGCSSSSGEGDVDALVSTSVAGTISVQSSSGQDKAESTKAEVVEEEKAESGKVEVSEKEKAESDKSPGEERKTRLDRVETKMEVGESVRNGKIAFVGMNDGSYEIYVKDTDGSNETQITNNNFGTTETPEWSPDGSKIAFALENASGIGIYVIDADGSNQTRLTDEEEPSWNPSWSPDG